MPKLSPFIGKNTKVQVGCFWVWWFTPVILALWRQRIIIGSRLGSEEAEYSECFKIQDLSKCHKDTCKWKVPHLTLYDWLLTQCR